MTTLNVSARRYIFKALSNCIFFLFFSGHTWRKMKSSLSVSFSIHRGCVVCPSCCCCCCFLPQQSNRRLANSREFVCLTTTSVVIPHFTSLHLTSPYLTLTPPITPPSVVPPQYSLIIFFQLAIASPQMS